MQELIVNNRVIVEDPIKILTDIQAELTNGKLSYFKISGSGISVPCPEHAFGVEKRNSCYLNLTKDDVPYLYAHCFTCNFSGPFEKFVGACFDRSEEFGAHWLISHYANDYVKKNLNLDPININQTDEKPELYLDESILDTFESYHPYMTQRKLTEDIINRFKIKYDPKTRCIVFPVRDKTGKLKYLTRRSVLSKKFIIDKTATKKDIYLLDEAIKNKCNEVIVCESQLNALTCYEYGYPGIALLGCGTTTEQVKELSNTDIRHFILMYDNDKAGREGAAKFKRLISKNKFVTDIIMPEGKDVNDCNKDEFISLLKQNGVIHENS